eukprot:CAMPEP_0182556882 /NCGR_PEP_ID=MMETSP1324-20130603/1009_1 /TAXON_ID=236786 /ORGANISM="Florenciella sp., Strain RCC1587" /LENGTH=45 /DNA_ID= /DNA_START= /DNA_END= /DNA_ORIENTATION=
MACPSLPRRSLVPFTTSPRRPAPRHPALPSPRKLRTDGALISERP